MKKLFLFLVLFSMLVGASAFPMVVPFQGKLRAVTAGDVNGTIAMTFALYDVETGGVAFWTAVKAVDVNIVDANELSSEYTGVFSVLLGESVLLDINSSKDLNYVGLAVGANAEMVPRVRVGASPYAYRALRAGDSDTLGGHTAETIFEADSNVFTSGVADCPADQYVYGFNLNGTIDCRADVQGSGADGFVSQGQLDANWMRMWQVHWDLNFYDLFHSAFTSSYDGNISPQLGNVFTGIDGNVAAVYGTVFPAIDGNASADGFVSQGQLDENWLRMGELYIDSNVEVAYGIVFLALDGNHEVLGQGQLDANWFRLAQPQIDSNIASVYGVVFPAIDGNISPDNMISIEQFDANYLRNSELYWDGNKEQIYGIVFPAIDGNAGGEDNVISVQQFDENYLRNSELYWDGNKGQIYGVVFPLIDGNVGEDNVLSQAQLDENSFRWWEAYSDGNSSADGFISQQQVDENWVALWEQYGDSNVDEVFPVMWVAVDGNHEVLGQGQLDENMFRWWEAYSDGNAASGADGMISQEQFDLNFYNLYFVRFTADFDGNISPLLGNVFSAVDGNHEVLSQQQLDENSFRWWEVYSDGNSGEDNVLSQQQLDENSFRWYEAYTDGNAGGSGGICDNNVDCTIIGRINSSFDANVMDLNVAGDLNVFGVIDGNVLVESVPGSTYSSLQDWMDLTQSAGLLTGGYLSSNGDGTITVTSGAGMVKVVDSNVGRVSFISWDTNAAVALADNAMNTIYVRYNGGSPVINSTTTPGASISYTDEFSIGVVYRHGNEAHTLDGGTRIYDLARRTQKRLRQVDGITRASGLVTTESGTRNIDITAGVLYAGLSEFSIGAFDSSGVGTFDYWFYDGSAWVEGDGNSTIDNTQYNNVASGLVDLTANRYGVHWVYVHHDSHVDVVYGQGDYTLAQAGDATPPSSLPAITTNFATIVAKIVIQKAGVSFDAVENPFVDGWTASLVDNHNDLGGIQGGTAGEYYHLTSADYTEVSEWLDDVVLSDGGNLNIGAGDLNAVNVGVAGFYFGDGSKLLNLPGGTDTWVTELVQDQNWMKMWELFWDGNISAHLGTVFTAIDGNVVTDTDTWITQSVWDANFESKDVNELFDVTGNPDANSVLKWDIATGKFTFQVDADQTGSITDTWVTELVQDQNFMKMWELFFDSNWMRLGQLTIDSNVSAVYSTIMPLIDGNVVVDTDTWITQSVWDANFGAKDLNELFDVMGNPDANSVLKWDIATGKFTFQVDADQTGGAAEDTWMPQSVWDANYDARMSGFSWVNTLPWADANVADDITLTNITQITNRAYSSLTDLPHLVTEADIDANATELDVVVLGQCFTSIDGNSFGDTWMPQSVWDSNWYVAWQRDFDNNFYNSFHPSFTASYDGNVSPQLGTVFTDIDGNVSAIYGTVFPAIDGNAGSDGFISQEQVDENFMQLWQTFGDVNISTFWFANWMASYDSNFYGLFHAGFTSSYDGNISEHLGIVFTAIDGNAGGTDTWMPQSVWDANFQAKDVNELFDVTGNPDANSVLKWDITTGKLTFQVDADQTGGAVEDTWMPQSVWDANWYASWERDFDNNFDAGLQASDINAFVNQPVKITSTPTFSDTNFTKDINVSNRVNLGSGSYIDWNGTDVVIYG